MPNVCAYWNLPFAFSFNKHFIVLRIMYKFYLKNKQVLKICIYVSSNDFYLFLCESQFEDEL